MSGQCSPPALKLNTAPSFMPDGQREVMVFPSSKTVKRQGNGNWHIYPDHADLNAVSKVPGCITVTGENSGPVTVFVVIDHLQRFFIAIRTHNA
jgi:hypothetical protein